MEFKTILNMVLSFILVMGFANSVTFYDSFGLTFTSDKPSDMKVMSFKCQDADCTNAIPANAEYFKGDAISCWYDYGQKDDIANFEICMENYKLSGDTLDLSDCDTISNGCSGDVYFFVKHDDIETASFGYVNHVFTKGDTYLPNFYWQTNFNCDSDVCIDINPSAINFVRALDGIAEIGKVNIKNINNPLFPVQVEVPVDIEETVCSAFQFSQPKMYKPNPPFGYSDYSVDTKVTLSITNEDTGKTLDTQAITIPILANQCAGLAAFSWTPDKDLENVPVKFYIETEIIDEQIVTSFIDWMEVKEVIYPQDLDGTCWTKAYDFVLSNTASQNIDTSLAQITVGETLYAVFDAGAWRDNALTPMDYTADIYFDSTLVHSGIFSSGNDVSFHSADLTDQIKGLPPGAYTVKLVTTPVGVGCTISESVEQIQNSQLLAPAAYNVNFFVKDPDYNSLESANVNLKLIDPKDYYDVDPVFDETLITDADGKVAFTNIIAGDYKYEVSYAGYTTVKNDIFIGGPMDIYITLDDANSAPTIDLPDNFTEYYKLPIEFDVKNYVTDFNDDVADLTYTYQIKSGSATANLVGTKFTITDNMPGTNTLEITVEDPQGETSTDTAKIIFTDNQAPVINEFSATPDSGANPLTTTFTIDVFDADGDDLECELNLNDGTTVKDDCLLLDKFQHTYTSKGTYKTQLSVNDGKNSIIESTQYIYVYNKVQVDPTPIINSFELNSSNGNNVPTDLTFTWDVDHNLNYPIECTLNINGVDNSVSCNSGTYTVYDFNTKGLIPFTLKVIDNESNEETDTISKTFMDNETPTPIINSFDLDSSNGNNLPTDLKFTWDVEHNLDYPIECTITINGADTIVPCNDKEYSILNFNTAGLSTFTLTVEDNESNEVKNSITQTFVSGPIVSPTPVIDFFKLDSSNGNQLPTDIVLTWNADHNLDYPITCVLTIDDIDYPLVACQNGVYNINSFNKEGTFDFVLRVIDNESNEVKNTITRTFIINTVPTPKINYFTLTSSNDIILPTDLKLDWDVSHNLNYPMNCSLIINSVSQDVSCSASSYNINDFNISGKSSFELIAIDDKKNVDSKLIEETFYLPANVINKFQVYLSVDSVIEPGKFSFKITSDNESLMKRFVGIKPIISCLGNDNILKTNAGYLDSSAVTKSLDDTKEHIFNVDTMDYQFKIPKDVNCNFEVILTDKYGSSKVLEKTVMFSYPEEELTFTSIRGKSTDVMDYMSSTLVGNGLNRGYNNVEFNLVNNENDNKDISVSMISQNLNINYKTQTNLAPGETRKISMPLYVKDNTKSGLYPVRYTINDGKDTQTRYSFIKIN